MLSPLLPIIALVLSLLRIYLRILVIWSSENNLFTYTLNDLFMKFHYIATTICYRNLLPSFMETWYILLIEEQQMTQNHQKQSAHSHSDRPSSPIFLTTDDTTQQPSTHGNFHGSSCGGGWNSRSGRGG